MTIFCCKTENLPDMSMHATITGLVYTFAAMIFALGSLSSADGRGWSGDFWITWRWTR
jgi:hypothetical protein